MERTIKVSAIQLSPNEDVAGNISKSVSFIIKAKEKGSDLVVLPELFLYRGDISRYSEVAEYTNGAVVTFFKNLAKDLAINLVLGTIVEKCSNSKFLFDTCISIDKHGMLISKYRKINLFKVCLENKILDESKNFHRGSKKSCFDLNGYKVSTPICFDLRFSDSFFLNNKSRAELFCVPANFTKKTGQAHWEILLRARAIESQSFVVAANCIGRDSFTGVESYGRSMIVDPWGQIIKEAGKGECLITAEINFEYLKEVRTTMPLWNK